MAQKGELRIKISAQDKASGKLRRVSSAIKGLVVAYLGFRGVRAAINLIKDVTREAMVQEKAIAKLSQQLGNWGDASDETINSLTGLAESLSKVTQFSDDQIIAGQAMLGSFALTGDQIKKATGRMLDVAIMTETTTGTMSDLTAVAKMLGMALNRNAGMLARAGIVMSDYQRDLLNAAKGMEKFNLLMKILDQNAKGLAKAVGKTWAGQMAIAKNQVNEIKEALGETIIKSAAWNTMLRFLTEQVINLTGWLQENKDEVKEWGNNFAFTVVNTVRTVIDTFSDLITAYSAVTLSILQMAKVTSYLHVRGKEMREELDGMIEDFDKIGVGAQTTKIKLDALAELLEAKMREAVYNTKEGANELAGAFGASEGGKGTGGGHSVASAIEFATKRIENFRSVLPLAVKTYQKAGSELGLVADDVGVKGIKMFEEWRAATFAFTVGWTDNVIDSFAEGRINFNAFVGDFLKGMTKMILKTLAFKALKMVFGIPFKQGGLVPAFQHGGYVPGGAPYSDRVPAMLSPGEFIMRREAVNRLGAENLSRLNQGGSSQNSFSINISMASAGSPSYDAALLGSRLEEEINELIRRKKIRL